MYHPMLDIPSVIISSFSHKNLLKQMENVKKWL